MFICLHPVEQAQPDAYVQDPIHRGGGHGGHEHGTFARAGSDLSADLGQFVVTQMLEDGQGVDAVARAAGFASAEVLRRARPRL